MSEVKCFVCSRSVGADGVLANGKDELLDLCAICNAPRVYDDECEEEGPDMTTYTAGELRALDVRVALALGYHWYKYTGMSENEQVLSLRPEGGPLWLLWINPDDSDCHRVYGAVPRFTTDPAAFMALLKELTSEAYVEVNIVDSLTHERGAEITAYWSDYRGTRIKRHSCESGPDIMISLALAAVAACEGEAGSK